MRFVIQETRPVRIASFEVPKGCSVLLTATSIGSTEPGANYDLIDFRAVHPDGSKSHLYSFKFRQGFGEDLAMAVGKVMAETPCDRSVVLDIPALAAQVLPPVKTMQDVLAAQDRDRWHTPIVPEA